MAKKNYKKKPFKKRAYKKKPYKKAFLANNKQHTTVRDMIITERMSVKLRYIDVDTPSVQTGGNSYNLAIYKMNSLYDFNANVGSTSIPGFSEWAIFYQYYKVNAIRYSVKCVNTTTTPVHIVVFPTINAKTFTSNWQNIYSQMGNPNSRNMILGGSNGNNIGHITGYIRYKDLFGKKDTYSSDTNYQGLVTGDPASLLYFYIGILGQDSVTTTNTVIIQPEFTIYADFFGRKQIVA